MSYQEEQFGEIADALREVSGTQDKIAAKDFASVIRTLSGSGGETVVDGFDVTSVVHLDGTQTLKIDGKDEDGISYQEKSITPTKEKQTVVPDIGYEAITLIEVDKIPDEYVIPDGTLEITENDTYDVTNYDSVNVKVAGSGGGEDSSADIKSFAYFCGKTTNVDNTANRYIIESPNFTTKGSISLANMFYDNSSISECPSFPTSTIKNMSYMFYGCTLLKSVSLLDTSRVTDMRNMFSGCSVLENVPTFDLSNVTTTYYMFNSCKKLTTIPQFNTSNVTNMSYMFYACTALTEIPQLDTSSVKDMSYMFANCSELTKIPQLNTSKVTTMRRLFGSCKKLTEIPLLDTSSVTNMQQMFYECSGLTTVPELNTSKVTNMASMFNYCTLLTEIPQLDTSSVTSMGSMFAGCTALTTIPLLDMIKVTSAPSSMFNNCTNLTNVTLKNIKVNLQLGSGTTYGHLLSMDSLINAIAELIQQTSARTLTIGSANLTKLANTYVKLIGDDGSGKLPFEVCESTDEGAMLIKDYVGLKNWSLA